MQAVDEEKPNIREGEDEVDAGDRLLADAEVEVSGPTGLVDKAVATSKEKKGGYFHAEPDGVSKGDFSQMNLSRQFLKAVKELGFKRPTPVQSRAIPVALMGHDVCGSAVFPSAAECSWEK